MKVVNKAAFPKAGLVSTFAHIIMYGPKSRQGGGRPEQWHWQEIHHILDLVEQVNAGNSLGLQYQVSLESLCFELGLPGPIIDAPYKQMKECTTLCLLKGVWEF